MSFQEVAGGWPKILIPIHSTTEPPIKVRAARAAAREYAMLLRDARSIGQGDKSFDEEADKLEKWIDYLDEEYPVC